MGLWFKPIGLVQRSAATWRRAAHTAWTRVNSRNAATAWWQHHKHCPGIIIIIKHVVNVVALLSPLSFWLDTLLLSVYVWLLFLSFLFRCPSDSLELSPGQSAWPVHQFQGCASHRRFCYQSTCTSNISCITDSTSMSCMNQLSLCTYRSCVEQSTLDSQLFSAFAFNAVC